MQRLTDLLHAARANASLWTPAVGFSMTLHLLLGISFIAARLRMDMAVTAYTRMFGGLTWLVGVGFIALYALAVVYPVRGAITAVLLCALVGLIVSVPLRDPVAIAFHVALPWFAITSTRKKLYLTDWLRDRRADYEGKAAGAQQTTRDLAETNRGIAADLAETNRGIATDLAETNRGIAADLAETNRDTAALVSADYRAQIRALTRQLRAREQDLRDTPQPLNKRGDHDG